MPNSVIAFVADSAQFRSLKLSGECSRWGIATADPDVVVQATEEGFGVFDLTALLSGDDARKHEERAWHFCTEVAQALTGRHVFDSCDIAHQMSKDLAFPVMCVINCCAMVSKLIASEAPRGVVHFAEMRRPFFWDPPWEPPDVFNAVVCWCAQRVGIPRHVVEETRSPPPAQTTVASRKMCSGLHSRSPSSSAEAPRPTLAFAQFLDGSEQEYLFSALAESGTQDWWVVGGSGVSGRGFPTVRFTAIRGLPFSAPRYEAGGRAEAEDTVSLLRRELGECYPELLGNMNLGFLWQAFHRSLFGGLRAYAAADFLARALRPRAVVLGYEVFGEVRCLVRAFHAHGIPTVSVHHGGPNGHRQHIVRRHEGADGHIVVWGALEEPLMTSTRSPRYRVYPAGSLRGDLSQLRTGARVAHAPGSSPLAEVSSPAVALLTARVASLSRPSSVCGQHLVSLRALRDWCVRKREWAFTLKGHPRYDYEHVYRVVGLEKCGNVRLTSEPAQEVLRRSHIAVLVNAGSSVAVEAIALDVPVVFLKAASRPGSPPLLLETGGCVVVRTVEELDQEVERLLGDTQYRDEVLREQRSFLDRALVATGEEAVERMLGFLASVERKDDGGLGKEPVAERTVRLLSEMERLRCGECGLDAFLPTWVGYWSNAQIQPLRQAGLRSPRALAHHLLGSLVDAGSRAPSTCVSPGSLMSCYFGVPSRWRPSPNELRRLLSYSVLSRERESAGLSRFILTIYAHILAPGRLLRRRCADDSRLPTS